jgi:hypothetical protein
MPLPPMTEQDRCLETIGLSKGGNPQQLLKSLPEVASASSGECAICLDVIVR